MKTWSLLYGMVWAAFLQILVILFPVTDAISTGVHMVLGAGILGMAYLAHGRVAASQCPPRIKRVTSTTFKLAVLQAALGVALFAVMGAGDAYDSVQLAIRFLHAVNALAIITQASSSATGFDMWEEKEIGSPSPEPAARSLQA